MSTKAITVALAAFVFTGPALAQSLDTNWSGFYGGGQLGFGIPGTNLFKGDRQKLYGLHAGYNHDFGKAVVGAELGYNWTDVKDTTSGVKLDNIARLKLRAGFDAGNWLPYVTAGATKGFGSARNGNATGHFYGIGVKHQMSDNIRIGGEVLHDKFGSFGTSKHDVDTISFAARISYNF